MDVRLPDGTMIQGVPDGTSRADLVTKLKANGYDTSSFESAAPEPGLLTKAAHVARDIGAGALRGAGSIGATILAPFDKASDVADYVTGEGPGVGGNERRRADMDQAMHDLVGADPQSLAYKGGKVAGEVAGTAGAGGAIAKGVAVLPGAAQAIPGLINAIRTGGMAAGPAAPGLAGTAANMATRAAGGAITGGASAAAVDPSEAGVGAAIGGAMPIAAKLAATVGGAIGRTITGPAQSADLQRAIQEARAAGYVIPPSQANPNIVNRSLEGLSGKLTTAQNASATNAEITASLAAQDLGLPAGTKITPGLLSSIRERAGQAYQAVKNTGVIAPSPTYEAALDAIQQPYLLTAAAFPGAAPSPVVALVDQMRSPAFASAAAVEKISQLRDLAKGAFQRGDNDVGRAARGISAALEDAVDEHLQKFGAPQLLDQYRAARQLIAKTHSVQDALNAETGSVNARNLASQLDAGKPLTGGLEQAARFALRFPKAAQPVEGMGSLPQTSPLDWSAATIASAIAGHPLPMLGLLARPAARAAILSPAIQNHLVQGGPNPVAALFANPRMQQLGYRAAPVLATDQNP